MKDSQAAGRRRASGAGSLSHGLYFDLPVEPVGVTKLKDRLVPESGWPGNIQSFFICKKVYIGTSFHPRLILTFKAHAASASGIIVIYKKPKKKIHIW